MQDQDRYRWVAEYEDRTKIYQRRINPRTGEEEVNQYEDIDRSRLRVFSLLDHLSGDPHVRIDFRGDGDKLVWTRRVQMMPGEGVIMNHVIGKKGRFVLLVRPTGQIEVMNNFSEHNVLFTPPTSLKSTNEGGKTGE